MASSKQPTTIEKLPNDILSSIFFRLLAKKLAQMRCVCKPWNAFLSQSSFIKSHLHHSIRSKDEVLLFFNKDFSFAGGRPFTAHPSRSPALVLTDHFIKLPVDLQSRKTHGNAIGSVNGLICFRYGPINDSTFYIWNPSLSAVLTLPPSSLPSHDCDEVGIPPRFGFDPKSDDYKLVKATRDPQPYNTLCPFYRSLVIDIDLKKVCYKVEVYSMRKGSWRVIPQSFPLHIMISMSMHYSEFCADGRDGYVHWLHIASYLQYINRIVAFDLNEETFCEIPLPDIQIDSNEQSLGVLGGKLCVMFSVINGGCEVWVMNEYGVAESWVKRYVFPKFSGDIIPYGFSLHNKFLFEVANYYYDDDDDDKCLGLYGPIAAKINYFEVRPVILKVVEYVDSLVWVTVPALWEFTWCH